MVRRRVSSAEERLVIRSARTLRLVGSDALG